MTKASNNVSLLERWDQELPQSTVYWMLIAIVAAQLWTIYLTYYNSQVLGRIITAIINKFFKYGHVKLGSFSFSVLSGKVMFRDVHLITEDMSIRIGYGWLIFRWWRPYVYKALNEDMSHLETRVSVMLDGFEFHVYNRTQVYRRLEKLFGLNEEEEEEETPTPEPPATKKSCSIQEVHWRDLVPVTKIEMTSGRVIFGNHLMPYSFLLKYEKADVVYTTKPASTVFDQYMHVVKCDMENVRAMLVPSPKYNGPVQDEPPRYMGDGFVVLMSNDVDVYFYMDQPGIVQHEPEQIQMADGEVLVKRTYPCVGVDIKCGKYTDFNYGPWVDRQRELIYKFFYPADYQPLVPTREAEPGEKRQYKKMEVKMSINAVSTIDILFTSKNAITQAIHMNAGKGSYVEVTIPYIIEDTGFTTKVKGQLMLVDATTSMSFRSLLECETLEFDLTAFYPKVWNACQEWRCDLTACKAVTYIIFDIKHFFADLVDDWSSKAMPDIYTFVPYTWTLTLLIKQFEILTLSNQNNWVDTSSQHQVNAHVAFCGEVFDLCVTFPFVDFMPVTVPANLLIKGETVFCRLYLPENNTIRHAIIAIADNMKIVDREGNECGHPFEGSTEKQWRKVTNKCDGWVDCWSTPYVFLTVTYTYYPMPVLMSQSSVEHLIHQSTSAPIPEEDVLNMTRQGEPSTSASGRKDKDANFNPGTMEPDLIQVELEVAPSVLVLHGSLLRNLVHLKENYFGEFQRATDFAENPSRQADAESSYVHIERPDDSEKPFDARKYRPFAVTVSVTLHDIQAHLAKNCGSDSVVCPSVHVERLCFEMDKSFKETKLQVLLSPCVLLAKDSLSRPTDQDHLKEGHLALSGVQVRGHAMFSLRGLPLESETLEYGWLIEVIVGELTGKLTTPQLQNIAEFLQTFIMTIENSENKLQTSRPFGHCQHMLPQDQCPESKVLPIPCPNSEDVKYEMTRVSVDFLNIFLVESGSALNVQVHPVRLSHCNLHGTNTRAGITGMIERIDIKQYVSCVSPKQNLHNWLEAGGLSLGPVMLEAAMALGHPQLHQNQDKFLRYHDEQTKRLWFLWPEAVMPSLPPAAVVGKCGCLGGCVFFGKNKNGLTFFKLRRHRDGTHVAVPQVCKDGGDPGFGQSLLHAGKLVFETSQLAFRMSPTKTLNADGFAFTRGYMSELASPDAGDEEDDKDSTLKRNAKISLPSEDSHLKSTFSETSTFPSSSKSGESRRESRLVRQNSMPFEAAVRSGSKKGRSKASQDSSKVKSRSQQKSISSAHTGSPGFTRSGSQRKSSKRSIKLRSEHRSEHSLNSEHYFTANESGSDEEDSSSRLPLAWSGPSTPSPSAAFFSEKDLKNFPKVSGLKQDSLSNKSTVFTHSTTNSSDGSTLSFCSAPTDKDSDLSDSDDDEVESEDMLDMIDLHSHMNQPIIESPLLLSCYSQHLSHYYCQDWSSTAPQTVVYTSRTHGLHSVQSEYSLSSAGHSIYSAGTAWTPQFVKVKDGFSVNVMKARSERKRPSSSTIATDLFNVKATMEREYMNDLKANQDDKNENPRENVSKTTAVVQLSGSLDVLVTPLLLESLQRYVEAVTPTLSKIHPPALIDSLHSQCLDRLKQQNKLKKGKCSDADGKEASVDNISDFKDVTPVKTSSLQALFTLPKINICVLQASIVEEVIAFSNLGSASDLTAVSLLAVCIDGIKCQLLANNHSCKVASDGKGEVLTRKTSSTPVSTSKHVTIAGGMAGRGKGEINPIEPDLEKPQEVTREENVGTLHISHVHIQLRRLLKFSNFSENVLLTAIPEQCSRVMFTLEQDTSSPLTNLQASTPGSVSVEIGSAHSGSGNFPQPSPKRRMSRTSSRDREGDPTKHFDFSNQLAGGIGFIMCECGLEDLSITAVRRLGYRDNCEAQIEEKLSGIDKTVLHLQETLRSKLEAEDEENDETGTGEEEGDVSVETSSEGPVPLSSPSCHVTSASLDSSPWDSVMTSELMPTSAELMEPLEGDASNGRLELKTIWFNFASPPPISIHKKVDYTRLDWNLLSTATPAIDAWLNPSDRLMNSVRQLVREYSKRLCCVMACMMIEGLESQGIHVAYKSKFNKLTPLSKTLQEDPSNQLLTVLRKYLHKYGTSPVEKAVAVETLPQLITVQKGILALMRQWKNVLYMPNLNQINFKTRRSIRPYNVSFALPKEVMDDMADENEEIIIDQFDVVDERISLLQAEGGITQRSGSVPSLNSKGRHSISTQGKTDAMDHTSAESFVSGKPRKHSGIFRAKKAVGVTELQTDHNSSNLAPPAFASLNRNDSNISFTSLVESVSSNEQAPAATPPHTPLRTTSGPKQSILKNRYHQNEDLYQWMAKQQGEFRLELEDDDQRYLRQNTNESCVGGLGSTWSQEDSKTDLNEDDYTMATSIMQLADAQILFKPVLQSLGLHVESVRPSTMMKKFGGHLLLQGHLNFFKILIAESETTPSAQYFPTSKGKGRGKKSYNRLHLETPAFQCESFDVNVSLKDVVDFGENGQSTGYPVKFAMHKLEAKPTTLQINLLVKCQAIRQCVDMALLRLAHQVLTMVGNVKETRVELKQKRTDHPSNWLHTHRKQESKDSTSSADTQHSDVSHKEPMFGSFQNIVGLEEVPDASTRSPRIEGVSVGPSVLKTRDPKWGQTLRSSEVKPSPRLLHQPHLVAAMSPKYSPIPSDQKPRPQGLTLESGPMKKPTHLRFAKDLKDDHLVDKRASNLYQSRELTPGQADIITPPQSLNLSDSVVLDLADTSSPAINEKTIIDEIEANTPQCWRHLYQLLELYATMPEPKTVARRHSQAVTKLPVIEEEDGDREGSLKRESRVSEYGSKISTLIQNRKSSVLHGLRRDSSTTGQNTNEDIKMEERPKEEEAKDKVEAAATEEKNIGNDSNLARQSFIRTRFKQSIYVGESIPLIVFGIVKVEKVIVSAELSGLKLEANTKHVHATGTFKKKVKGFLHRVSSDSSYTAHVGHSMINLREGEPPDLKTVVTINISKSQALLTSVMRRGKEHNSMLTSIGLVELDIPQHPVVLHDMMARSTKRITATLQELRWPTQSTNRMHFSPELNENQSSMKPNAPGPNAIPYERLSSINGRGVQVEAKAPRRNIRVKSILQGIAIGASILPSLKAQYKTDAITLTGVMGKKSHFTIMLPKHLLSFKSKVTAAILTETPIPSAASIVLPPIQVIADYRVQKADCQSTDIQDMYLSEGLELVDGNYLYAVAEVGMLEHSLTTDLLNHLVFVQKVFMKEINEIVQKVSGGQSSSESIHILKADPNPRKPLLYSVSVRFKGIQVTATTPTSNAVRFETGAITLDLSNRFHLPKQGEADQSTEANVDDKDSAFNQKMFIQAVVDMNLALGQLLKNPVFDEAEPEFHTMAFFKTTIKIRNALQHEMMPNLSNDQEALLINLTRPIILAQPLAFDKAVLVWLNYKNAYEYWTEQRMALNKEVLTATRQVIDKLPQIAPTANPAISTLFLQLTVDDMGICVPLISSQFQQQILPTHAPGFQSPRVADAEQGSALVLTVESTQISACSSGSLVSKGKFKGFCLRFADDFGSSWDDWKPWPTDSGAVMNQCKVPSGTYEVCSRTINKQDTTGNAKWILNVLWDMKGMDVHLDTDLGKRFTLLGHTLTMLAGHSSDDMYVGLSQPSKTFDGNEDDDVYDEDDITDVSTPDTQENSQEDLQNNKRRTSLASDILPEDIFSDNFDPKERARKIEQEMNEQAKVVQELQECGATETTIETEKKKLDDLQALLFQDFRREFLDMLKRKGDRASLIKDKLGLSSRPTHYRSKSTGGQKLPKIKPERQMSHMEHIRRQSEELARPTKVSFSGMQLNSYTPPMSPQLDPFEESGSEKDGDEDNHSPVVMRSRSLEVIPSSGSDSQNDLMDDATPQLRRSQGSRRSTDDSGMTSPRDGSNKLSEQSIDFELDVKVFIDRGNCVLYPKEAKEEEVRKHAKRDRQSSGDSSSSPTSKRKVKREGSGGSGVGTQRKISAQPDTTVFFVPSVDVKIHYNSKTENLSESISTDEPIFINTLDSTSNFNNSTTAHLPIPETRSMDSPHPFVPEITITTPLKDDSNSSRSGLDPLDISSPRKSGQLKRASLYAWFSLQTLPDEMIISPALLNFLEQALEPLPITPGGGTSSLLKRDMVDSLVNNMDLDASQGSLGQQSMAFFPVDVVVHIKVDPSYIRFNCHPVSRVECLLQVPSLDLFFSTKKTDINESMLADATLSPKPPNIHSPSGRTRHSSGVSDASFYPGSSSGGLSVTGCMSDFSLYIFHPYGTGVQRRLIPHADSPSFRSQGLGSISEHSMHAIHDLGRRDSLSLNVEFIHVNISRTRKLERFNEPADSTSKIDQQTRSNAVRFSAICDIGTATFKYDMRRLTEILSLPKAWYRRTLARRLFLGDESIHLNAEDALINNPNNPVDQLARDVGHRKKSRTLSSPDMQQHRTSVGSNGTSPISMSNSWETLVLFAVNLSQLNLEVNMANVMGITEWCTKEIKSQGRLSINSSGHKNLNIEAGFEKSSFESKGGIVGGTIDLQGLQGYFTVSEDPALGRDPDHQAGLVSSVLETRIDYMGSSIIMTRLSNLDLLLKDEWHVDTDTQQDLPLATNRSAFLFVNGNLSWSHLHLMISRSTTPDLIKIISKLDEFFSQQVMSSRRVFQHTDAPFTTPLQPSKVPRKISESAVMKELRHHRHWQAALHHLLGCQFSMLPSVLPREGMVLGGTMTLRGQGLMLASFHGVNFKSTHWALFNIKEPYIHFSTEAQRIPERGTHIVQDLHFRVGHLGNPPPDTVSANALHNHMATICKISRTQNMPPNFPSVGEWFIYAMTCSATDPEVVTEFGGRSKDIDLDASRKYSKVKADYYSHDTEVIFAFPSMYMNLKTSHFQGDEAPEEDGARPVVECSFVAEFSDHIYVAMDAEAILFLHDLVASYIREKDKGCGSRSGSKSGKEASKSEEKSKLSNPTSALKHDFRTFECKTWQLEPTLRLIHWASTKIDPVGADYVLQKLGFSKARVTIPKWVQRGFMDPLDKVISVLVDRLVITLRDQQSVHQDDSVDLDISIGPASLQGLDRSDRPDKS